MLNGLTYLILGSQTTSSPGKRFTAPPLLMAPTLLLENGQ